MPNYSRYLDDDYGKPKNGGSAPAPRQPLSARPEPAGVHILDAHRRVGDTQRNTYLDHLSDLHARGYLPQEEFEARQAAVQNAEVEYDLNRLISDTPGLVEPRRTSAKRLLRSPAAVFPWLLEHKDNAGVATAGFLAWLMASVAWATVVPGVLGAYSPHASGLQVALAVFFIVSAVASIVCLLVTLVSYVDNHS